VRRNSMDRKAITRIQAIILAIIIIVIVIVGVIVYITMVPPPRPVVEEIKVGASCPMSGELATWGKYLSFGY